MMEQIRFYVHVPVLDISGKNTDKVLRWTGPSLFDIIFKN